VQPIRVKKYRCWVRGRMDEIVEREGAALRKVNGSVDGIFRAVAEIGRMVNELSVEDRIKGNHGLDKWGKEREEDGLAVYMAKGVKEEGVSFVSKVLKQNDGSSWFPTKAESSALPPGVAAIATLIHGSKSSGAWATKAEVLKMLRFEE